MRLSFGALGLAALASFAVACAPPAPDQAQPQCASTLRIGSQVLVPAGRVVRGNVALEVEEAIGGEGEVGAFSIDAHEVTNAQFAAFVSATNYVTIAERAGPDGQATGAAVFDRSTGMWRVDTQANWRRPEGASSSINGRERYPVTAVAYEDAEAYARWAGRRLPTENEWEFAMRGAEPAPADGGAEAFDAEGRPVANTWQGVFPIQDSGEDGYQGLAPVGCFPANARGLHDMIGNVWEWTTAAVRPGQPTNVIKGGSFLCAANYCARYRPAARQFQERDLGTDHIGFRLVNNTRPAPMAKR